MFDDYEITGTTAVGLFAAHLGMVIRTASSFVREQRSATSRHQRSRHISERITRGQAQPPPTTGGDERAADRAIEDIQLLSDALSNLGWLANADPKHCREAIAYHLRVIESLESRLGERAGGYRFEPQYLRRCLAAVEITVFGPVGIQ